MIVGSQYKRFMVKATGVFWVVSDLDYILSYLGADEHKCLYPHRTSNLFFKRHIHAPTTLLRYDCKDYEVICDGRVVVVSWGGRVVTFRVGTVSRWMAVHGFSLFLHAQHPGGPPLNGLSRAPHGGGSHMLPAVHSPTALSFRFSDSWKKVVRRWKKMNQLMNKLMFSINSFV